MTVRCAGGRRVGEGHPRVGEGQGGRPLAEGDRPLAPLHIPRPCSGTSSWDGEGADPGTQGRSRADYVAADAAADVGDRWLRQTSSLLHSGGHDNVEKEEVNSGA